MAKRRILGMPRLLFIGILALLVLLLIVGFLVGPLGRKIFGDLGLPAWLGLPKPELHLPAETVFYFFGFPIANSIIGAWITLAVLICLSYVITRRMKVVPGRLQSAFESLLGWLYDLCRRVAGEANGRRFFPIVATIFLFVAFNAWLSLIPGFGSIFITSAEGEHVHLLRGANTDINMPLALALVSFVFVEYFGLRSLGLRYLGKFLNVGQFFQSIGHMVKGRLRAGLGGMFIGFINIFIGLLEALSETVRLISFTFRLFGNMTAGEVLLLIAAFLIPWVIATPFYLLELLIGFLQALIFCGLTLAFLTLATAQHGE